MEIYSGVNGTKIRGKQGEDSGLTKKIIEEMRSITPPESVGVAIVDGVSVQSIWAF